MIVETVEEADRVMLVVEVIVRHLIEVGVLAVEEVVANITEEVAKNSWWRQWLYAKSSLIYELM